MFLEEWYYSSRTLKLALLLFGVNFFIITLAFATPYWLVSVPDESLPNPKFVNLGTKYWSKMMYCVRKN